MKLNLNKKRLNKQLSIFEILTHFQTAAVTHATNLGFGFNDMLSNDMFWVVLRTKFIVKDDVESDDINIFTYPKEGSRAYSDREYILSNNKILVEGISRWCIMSASNRRILRSNLEYKDEFHKESLFKEVDKIDYDEQKFNYINSYTITKEDLDDLNHLNNVNYAKIIESVYKSNNLKEFQIDYLNEALLDDVIKIYLYKDNGIYIKGVIKEKNCFIAKIGEK